MGPAERRTWQLLRGTFHNALGSIPERLERGLACVAVVRRNRLRDAVELDHGHKRRQLFFSWTATKRLWSPDLMRTSTALRPSFAASLMPLARSSGFFTARPPTSRITSPVLMPFWAASEPLSTSVTITPSLLAPVPGATVRPS